MSKLVIAVMVISASGIAWLIAEGVKQDSQLHMLKCNDKVIMVDTGPIRYFDSGKFETRTGKVYTPEVGSICYVERINE